MLSLCGVLSCNFVVFPSADFLGILESETESQNHMPHASTKERTRGSG